MSDGREGRSINDMLRHLGCGRELRDFPGTASEKVALVRTAQARGLIAWRKARTRYEVTSIGWAELMPRRRFGVASLMVSAAAGGVIGAAALAVSWPPVDASYSSVRAQSPASISRTARPGVLQASRSTRPGPPSSASLQPVSTVTNNLPAIAGDVAPGVTPLPERPDLTGQVAAEQPRAEVAFTGEKPAAAKKARHRTTHRRRRDQGAARGYAGSWGGQQFRYADYRERGAWPGYR